MLACLGSSPSGLTDRFKIVPFFLSSKFHKVKAAKVHQSDRHMYILTFILIEAAGMWLCVEAGAEQRQHGHLLDLVFVGCYREKKINVKMFYNTES